MVGSEKSEAVLTLPVFMYLCIYVSMYLCVVSNTEPYVSVIETLRHTHRQLSSTAMQVTSTNLQVRAFVC